MKQILNTHDIYVLVNELKKLEGYRVLNIYDIDSKTICIKLNPNKNDKNNQENNIIEDDEQKKYLIIESGSKFYLINNFSAIRDSPTSFCSKLRKHLKNKRLEKIIQVNLDRVIDLTFGSDELEFHIIVEFYASGNIVFTSKNYNILTLLHPYTYEIKNENNDNEINISKIKVCVGNIYPFELATQSINLNESNIIEMFEENLKKLDKKTKLKQFVNKLPIIKYSSNVLQHSFYQCEIDTSLKVCNNTKINEIFKTQEQIKNFIKEINKLYELEKNDNYKFIGYKNTDNIYPYAYSHIDISKSETKSFSDLLSSYFQIYTPIQTKEMIKKKESQLKLSKQEKVIYNIEQQIISMEKNIGEIQNKIDILTNYINFLNKFINLILTNVLTDYVSMNNDFFKFIEIIEYQSIIKIELEGIIFELNYSKSVFANRDKLFTKIKKISSKLTNAKVLLEKQKKILIKSNFLNKNFDSVNNYDFKENKYKIIGQLKPNWFEQFNWFFTSDNLLFICGKNAEQNELIVKRYMDDTDIYIHSDSFGSGSGILKNNLKLDIPNTKPKSLIECANFLIAHTKAWDSGISNSAYWVKPSQVSKTPESGEYICKGSFIIRGQKNFIRVDKIELGFGIIFKILEKEEFNGYLDKNEKIEYAMPILSTYSAISSYKFKIKVVHGTQKVNRALKDVLNNFTKKSNLYEKEAIKKISNDSIQKVLINKIKFIISK